MFIFKKYKIQEILQCNLPHNLGNTELDIAHLSTSNGWGNTHQMPGLFYQKQVSTVKDLYMLLMTCHMSACVGAVGL